MSSAAVRTAIKAAVEAAAAPWDVLDLSDYLSIDDALSNASDQAVLIQYVVADEQIASIGGEGNQGWEEEGSVVVHLVTASGFASSSIVTKGDAIREALRGSRLTSNITIESCEPFTDFGTATGLYGGTVKGWAANLYYRNRSCG